ncbi:juvenile hormone esterase-like [Linepithema humile]|uniref:juvenile hormone esterase-like n=1 Tax=Linepithema humile TaxID=83485 RepID=UPI000623A033|nr:PREDICTED: esterase FE4-like [Linepithema humile]
MHQRESLGARYIALTKCPHSNERIWRCVCILAFLFIVAGGFLSTSQPLVVTKWGMIYGKWTKSNGVRSNRLIANFLGIPYALPPVGDLRFKSPQRWNRPWMHITTAVADGPKCIQWSKSMSEVVGNEDCLYLNIFIPAKSMNLSDLQQTKLPVLVFIHGGQYHVGSNNSTELAPDYLTEQDVILVTVNYRLNILGFFSTTNEASPGNYGVKDIKMALEWIQENIRSFHGNPESVTVMGQSAGAAIIHLLSLTSKTEGLFHKYILHSGSALSPWALQPSIPYRQICLEVARLVGCLPEENDDIIALNETTTQNYEEENQNRNYALYDAAIHNSDNYNLENDEEMMKCMRKIDAKKIGKMSEYFVVSMYSPICIFGPTLEADSEDAIVTIHPMVALKNGLFRDIPAIMQVVKDEGLKKTLEFYIHEGAENEMIKNFEEYLPYFIESQLHISNTSVLAAAIEDFYFNGTLTLDFKQHITNMLSDAVVIWPTFQALQYQSKIAKSGIYFSYFIYQGTFSTTLASGKQFHYGISHSDDLNYLFPVLNAKYQDWLLHNTMDDITIISIMTEMWANFAKEGVPRAWLPWFNFTRHPWPDYRDRHQFMRFNKTPDIVVETDFLSDRMEFWETLMPNVSMEIPDQPEKKSGNANVICCRLIIPLISLIIVFFVM